MKHFVLMIFLISSLLLGSCFEKKDSEDDPIISPTSSWEILTDEIQAQENNSGDEISQGMTTLQELQADIQKDSPNASSSWNTDEEVNVDHEEIVKQAEEDLEALFGNFYETKGE